MQPSIPFTLAREGLMMLASVGGPVLAVLLAVGLVFGILQAATQVNDPAVNFLPRLLTVLLSLWLLGGWMMERLAEFVASALQQMVSR